MNHMVVAVGQFIYRKGFDVLLKAWKNCPADDELYIIGDKPTEDVLRLKALLNLKNVYFPGYKNKAELNQYYDAADLFVLPTREDIWGLVINEAMAHGLPVITTDRCVAGIELVQNGINGYIVPTDNHKILCERINKILNDDNLRENMAQENLRRIHLYTIENMVQKHMEGLYQAS